MPTINRKKYIDPDGKIQYRKPAIWNNTSPITDGYLEANGWTIEEEAIEVQEPVEDTARRDAAELKIVQAIYAIAGKYNALQAIARLEDLTIPGLEQLMEQYGVTPEDKADVLGVVQLQSLELMALDPAGWAAIWEGFKSRFAGLFRQVAIEDRPQDL